MKPALRDALLRDFPKLYEHLERFGFRVDDGWEPIIRRLSEKLEPLGVRAHQVKEKFGGLRFYFGFATDSLSPEQEAEIEAAIKEAEREADKTCEVCGEPGFLCVKGHWYKTLCEAHRSGTEPVRCWDISDVTPWERVKSAEEEAEAAHQGPDQ